MVDTIILNLKNPHLCGLGVVKKIENAVDVRGVPIKIATIKKRFDLTRPLEKYSKESFFGLVTEKSKEFQAYESRMKAEINIEYREEECIDFPAGSEFANDVNLKIIMSDNSSIVNKIPDLAVIQRLKKELDAKDKAIEEQKKMMTKLTKEMADLVPDQMTKLGKNKMLKELVQIKDMVGAVDSKTNHIKPKSSEDKSDD